MRCWVDYTATTPPLQRFPCLVACAWCFQRCHSLRRCNNQYVVVSKVFVLQNKHHSRALPQGMKRLKQGFLGLHLLHMLALYLSPLIPSGTWSSLRDPTNQLLAIEISWNMSWYCYNTISLITLRETGVSDTPSPTYPKIKELPQCSRLNSRGTIYNPSIDKACKKHILFNTTRVPFWIYRQLL